MANKLLSNKLKNLILERINYTNLDYDSIMNQISEMFFPSDNKEPISYSWNNVSEADPFFIQLHLMAAHMDMMNYMVDYRVRESFMSTAVERASMVRHANSKGYKIPSYFPTTARYKLQEPDAEVAITRGTSFVGGDGLTYTYLGEDEALVEDLEIELLQGHKIEMVFGKNTIDPVSRTKVISNYEVAIRPNDKASLTSYLLVGDTEYKEVTSLLTYAGTDKNVYELNVDPYRQTYIKFPPEFFDNSEKTLTLVFLLTEGRNITGMDEVLEYKYIVEDTERTAVFELVQGSEVLGRNPADETEIKNGYINFCASIGAVVTLQDYYNFVEGLGDGRLKLLTADSGFKYTTSSGYIAGTYPVASDIVIITNDTSYTKAEVEDFDNIKINDVTVAIIGSTKKDTYVKLSQAVSNDVKQFIMNYINNKEIGSTLTSGELSHVLSTSVFSNIFKDGISISIGFTETPTDNELELSYNEEFFVGSISNITSI